MSTEEPPGRRGRPRLPETDQRIASAARALIRDHGPQAVSVAAVAERSGVARTTIYRRHADRSSLLRAALEPVTRRGAAPERVDVAGHVEWMLVQAEQVVLVDIGPGGVAAVLTESDPEFSDALRVSLQAGLEPVVHQITADVENRVLVPLADPGLVVNLVLGSCLAELLLRGTPTPEWRTRTAAGLAALLTGAT